MELKHGKDEKVKDGIVLLIVPYGIETSWQYLSSSRYLLLIVPYGIETRERRSEAEAERTFNRTLWN